jgi:shikimate kinase
MNTFFLVGFMGCGKSYWGKIWAEAYGLSFYETDELVEAATGKTIAEIFEADGEMYFREKESAILKALTEKSNCIVSTGGGAPCFFNNMGLMKDNGTTIYLKAPPQLLAQRLVTEKAKRPLIKSIPDNELESFIAERLAARIPYYEMATVVLDAAELTAASMEHLVKK